MFKGWIDKLTKKQPEDATPEDTSPEAVKKKKIEAAEKKLKRVAGAIRIAGRGVEIYKRTADNVSDATERVVDATKDLAGKAKPATDLAKGALGGAFDSAKDKISEGTKAAGDKLDKIKQDNAKKPSTGSSLLDLLAPAVPETEATKPKVQKPPQP